MSLIPLIYIVDRKILFGENSEPIPIEDFINKIREGAKIYIFDKDGIERDRPNFDVYQKLSNSYDLWVDFGPRTLGDIVDGFFTGISNITIRKDLCKKINAIDIREITENKFYANVEFEKNRSYDIDDAFFTESDGLVNFYSRSQIESVSNNLENFFKYKSKNNIFTFEKDVDNLVYWKSFDIQNYIIEQNRVEEFEKWILK